MKTEERQQMKHESIGKATYEGKSKCMLQSLLERHLTQKLLVTT